ncbi:TetR/AcrR family transcriptional regulator [Evansella sp. AB-P1]|uniref:TetR/AcrR family transcriptional regulator n=1 Tax=Evansella sp. AB-P1 TaxID=3037653 RepID=UPI00241F921A|nr:TetR/AcrR family transcriptional regulator [Evansella sp. AB-P1]MDG5786496.1 TetR/AcrR family transcriptional regulator [Evansella sp. AB-P1]
MEAHSNDFLFVDYNGEELNEKQISILKAAIDIIAEKGFSSSRTSEIAKKAGVSEGTLFRYFPSKKDMMLALLPLIIHHFFKPIIEETLAKIKEDKKGALNQELTLLFKQRLHLIDQNRKILKIVLIESIYYPELMLSVQKLMEETIYPSMEQFIEQQREKHKLRKVDSTTISRSFISLLLGYIVLSNYFPKLYPRNDETEITKMVDILLNGIKR